jgi:hypothetical protein
MDIAFFYMKNDLPKQLIPVKTEDFELPNGRTVSLPVCTPVFSTWKGHPLKFDYGNKPILNYKGNAYFAELVILNIFIDNGWDGVWVGTYGGINFLKSMPQSWGLKPLSVPIPNDKEELLKKIQKAGGTKSCFDVFAWHGDKILFCESKHAKKDRINKPQLKFVQGALACGISPESLMLVEWSTT